MSGLDDLLGSVLGGKGGGSGLEGALGGLLGGKGGGSGAMMALLPLLAGMLGGGGLSKILSGFQQKGLGAQADSWVGTGANQPVSGDQVREVMTEEQIGEIAAKLGVSHDEAASAVAEVLPQLVDKASPDGTLPAQGELDSAFDKLRQGVAQAG
jgi:uncharacterized protein YidB (DUF937 family)